MLDLARLADALRASRGFAHKRDIADVLARLGHATTAADVPNGDDCAVLPEPSGDGHLLLAIEGLMQDFVEAMPWFAGYSGVMVNLSDVAAMGGRPIAVVDALWSADDATTAEILAGMRAASERYGVPIVGGHTNLKGRGAQLAVAVLGRAQRLISSFAARPGDVLLAAIDLRGHWHDPYPFWDASTSAPAERLRADLALLPTLAERGWCDAGKDISMAGLLGTALMLIECSRVGARIALDRIPRPAGVADDEQGWLRWLSAFPSYGYLLSTRPERAEAVIDAFKERAIACAAIGDITGGSRLELRQRDAAVDLWDWRAQPFIGAYAATAAHDREPVHA